MGSDFAQGSYCSSADTDTDNGITMHIIISRHVHEYDGTGSLI